LTTLLAQRLERIQHAAPILAHSLRGIEREGLRVTAQGELSAKPHPQALGSALTHPHVTTDYSEALLELITGTHKSVDSLMKEVDWVHRLVASELQDEVLWTHSMPALLPTEAQIPIAWYGTSNTGMLKHVYRRGLAVRYGKPMQCIAGLHYNFSFDDALWSLLDLPGDTPKDRQSAGYIGLVRNFVRYNWLLMYLFGASPAVSKHFVGDQATRLQQLDDDTLYLPWATSLRMSDFGYQNKAQSSLKLCYNDLPTFLKRLYGAVTTPWPAYEQIGTQRDGQWVQLNCNLLQIENEFYSTIRPKRTTSRGERPITALAQRGVQYVEVRCLDIDPFEPSGLSAGTAHFLDAFLLFCAIEHSPWFEEDGFCHESARNFARVVRQGREPDLALERSGTPVGLTEWANELLDRIASCASLLAEQTADDGYLNAVAKQRAKLENPALTPSARVLQALQSERLSFQRLGLEWSKQHTEHFKQIGLSAAEQQVAQRLRESSLLAQRELEADTSVSFEDYVRRFHDALQAP